MVKWSILNLLGASIAKGNLKRYQLMHIDAPSVLLFLITAVWRGKMTSWDEIEEKIEQEREDKLDWTVDETETILIYGLPKHGKTYAYCSVIEKTINDGGEVYVISTDSGFVRTAKTYFGEKIKDVYKKIHLELVYDISSIRSYYKTVEKNLKKKDLLVIDLVSDVWDWAQIAFVDNLSQGDIEKFMINAMKDSKAFGMFDSSKWNYIKALHKFIEDIIVRKPCNFVGVATEKDTTIEETLGKDKARQLLNDMGFDDLTTRPGGMKLLPYKFETILRVGIKDNKHFFQVVGDRGYIQDLKFTYYDKEMYKTFLEWRKKR